MERFMEQYQAVYQDMYRLAYYYMGNAQDAEDAVQETALAAYENFHRLKDKEAFRPWIFRILVNRCKKSLKKRNRWGIRKEAPEPLELSRPEVKRLLERSGVPEEKLDGFDDNFMEAVGEKNTLLASNIASTKTFQIETPDVIVKVNPERSDLVETREIDGRRCLVIAIDDHLEVNGIEINL